MRQRICIERPAGAKPTRQGVLMSDHPPLPTRLTVAALVQLAGRFLLVEEEIAGQRRFNQPAGHVEPGKISSRRPAAS